MAPGRSSSSRATVDVSVEIPKGSRAKYEYDERSGRIRLERVLYSSVHYPGAMASFRRRLEGTATRSMRS